MLQLTIKANGDLLGRNNLHGNRLLVRIQIEILYPWSPAAPLGLFVAVVLAIALAAFARQYGVELARGGRCFGASFFLGLGIWVEAREEVADDKVRY